MPRPITPVDPRPERLPLHPSRPCRHGRPTGRSPHQRHDDAQRPSRARRCLPITSPTSRRRRWDSRSACCSRSLRAMIPVRCNNHPWMEAFINVAPNPFFAISDADGHYQIQGLPPGTYKLSRRSRKARRENNDHHRRHPRRHHRRLQLQRKVDVEVDNRRATAFFFAHAPT